MKRNTFIVGAIILTIGGFVSKIIGAFYKIPLTNILGSTGMGIYYLVFPVYSLLLVVSSSGVSLAVSKLVAEARVKKIKRNETAYFLAGITISFLLSFSFSLLVMLFSEKLAFYQGNILSKSSFVAIAPAVLSASLVSVIKGYFQGVENMFPSSLANIFEQIVKSSVGLLLSYNLLSYGLEYAVLGSVLAVSISETMTLFLMSFNYLWHKKHNDYKFYTKDEDSGRLREMKRVSKLASLDPVKVEKLPKYRTIMYFYNDNKYISFGTALRRVTKLLIPNTLTSLVIPFTGLIDSFLVLNLLTKSGYSSMTATSLYGLSNGVVSSLISLPVIVTSSLAVAIVPNLSGLLYAGDREELHRRSSFFIKITCVVVVPMFVFFMVMSPEIISALYNFKTNNVLNEFAFASKLLMLSSVSIIYSAFLSTFVSILQAVNKSYKVFFIMLLGLIIRTILSIVLIQMPQINIFGVVIANIIFLSFCDVWCLNLIRNRLNLQVDAVKSFLVPISAGIMAGVTTFVFDNMLGRNLNIWLNLVLCGVLCIVVYFSAIFALRCFDGRDEKYLPFKKYFAKLKK